MNNEKKTLKGYLIYVAYALLWAGAYGAFSYVVLFRRIAGENLFYAYIWNIGFLLFALAADRLMYIYLQHKKETLSRSRFRSFIHRVFFTKYSLASFKTALYVFHVLTMIFARLLILNPDIEVSESIRNYLETIEPVLLLLVIFDIFIEHIVDDDKRVKELVGE